jgi:serine/threonine protein phosphatase 1
MELNIIGDIAGQFETLKALLMKMPAGHVVLVGDLIDRGPQSREVLEWAMKEGPEVVTSILGNHEQLMLDSMVYGSAQNWLMNGGGMTARQYMDAEGNVDVPIGHLKWLATRPLYHSIFGLLVTHAGVTSLAPIDDLVKDRDHFIWNRMEPNRRDQYQVFGHNSHWGLRTFSDESGPFATCIDTSRSRVLTGMHWPSKEIYQQPYIEG